MMHLDTLACGFAVVDVVAHLDGDASPVGASHVADCRFCRSVRTSLGDVDRATQTLAKEPVEAPSSLVGAVMARVTSRPAVSPSRPRRPRRTRTRSTFHAVTHDQRGAVWIADRVVSRLVRRAAVAALRRPATPRGKAPDRVVALSVEVGSSEVVGQVSIEIAWDSDPVSVSHHVRELVARELASVTGLHLRQLDIRIVGLTKP